MTVGLAKFVVRIETGRTLPAGHDADAADPPRFADRVRNDGAATEELGGMLFSDQQGR
jgi:hypothetical protein